jgi:hypothetical protein
VSRGRARAVSDEENSCSIGAPQKNVMRHMQIAFYRFKPGTVDLVLRQAERELLPLFRRQFGCVAYDVVKTGPGAAISVSTWDTRRQGEAAEQMVAAWVQQHVAEALVSVETHIGGLAFSLDQIRPGMEVKTADGITLGTIAEVWVGSDPVDSATRWDDEVCSRLEVQQPLGRLYDTFT